MDQAILRERESRCTQEQSPKCSAECPVHVDVKAMLKALESGEVMQAYKIYMKSVPFPQIISRICEAPCEAKCLRNEIDQSIQIHKIEQSIMEQVGLIEMKHMMPPEKKQKVAIVGSGISGLTVAKVLRLKGYGIEVFESRSETGGKLRQVDDSLLPKTILNAELNELMNIGIRFNLSTTIGLSDSLDDLMRKFDALYLDCGVKEAEKLILTGSNEQNYNEQKCLLNLDPFTLAFEQLGLFGGGGLLREDQSYRPIESLSDGKRAANSIDRFLQGVSMTGNRKGEGSQETQLYTNIDNELYKEVVKGSGVNASYTAEDALEEAHRCIQCECLECVKACTFMQHYKGYPKRYFREIYNNMSIVMGIHYANKMINSCSQCGQCSYICPNDADMGQMCQDAKLNMVQTEKMPPSAHDFPLRDMAFSTSDAFALFKHQPGFDQSNHIFFPGCQLSASSSEQVEQVYDLLTSQIEGGVGLMLNCCGAPAKWAGRMELLEPVIHEIEQIWEQSERAIFITACPSCKEMFKAYLPQIEVKMLYPILEKMDLQAFTREKIHRTFVVHDSCSTRFDETLQTSVRQLLMEMGCTVKELKYSKDKTSCCGYGGLMMFTNPEVSRKSIRNRIQESDEDYLSYCVMCRDNFASEGKKSWHILDLIFSKDLESAGSRPSPDYSTRHEQRYRLKRKMLQSKWGESLYEGVESVKLIMSDDVRVKMASRNILLEDLKGVLRHVTETNSAIWHPGKACYVAYYQSGAVTYWVEYLTKEENLFEILNTYSHRLTIEL